MSKTEYFLIRLISKSLRLSLKSELLFAVKYLSAKRFLRINYLPLSIMALSLSLLSLTLQLLKL